MFKRSVVSLLCVVCAGALISSASAGDRRWYTYTNAEGQLVTTDQRPNYPPLVIRLYTVATEERSVTAAPIHISSLSERMDQWDAFLLVKALKHGVPAELAKAIMLRESGMNPAARSPYAFGLMQLIPSTARRMGVSDIWDPEQNIDGGVRYIRFLAEQFAGRSNQLELVAAGYNAGEGAVARAGYTVPPFRETKAYVPRVIAAYKLFLEEQPIAGSEVLRPRPGDSLYPGSSE